MRSFGLAAGTALLAWGGATGALAQNISNEAWLGQIGGTNVITIDQSGRNNQAGANNTAWRLNQDGNDNVLVINQFGHRNQVGAEDLAPSITGINQVGSRNEIDIKQSTGQHAFSGFNVVGAIYQASRYSVMLNPANKLTVRQSGEEAGHHVRTVRQFYFGSGSGDDFNEASITQTGGGPDEAGNRLGDLFQWGTSNSFTLIQGDQANTVSDVRQSGNGNVAEVEQDLFSEFVGGNLLQYLHQFGFGNIVNVAMKGEHNAIQRIFQFNAYLGAVPESGNTVLVTLRGKGNGGSYGGISNFLSNAALAVSAAQADIVQIGDKNHVSIEISGEDNRFGSVQFGDDNHAEVSVASLSGTSALDASRNESALFQSGTGNHSSHTVRGSDNVGAARQFGAYNRLTVDQQGDGNLADVFQSGRRNQLEVVQRGGGVGNGNLAVVTIFGDRNNSALGGAASFSGLVASALAAPGLPALTPGRLFQEGLANNVRAEVYGDDNRFAFHQQGNGNLAESIVIGSGNQLAVVQIGNSNIATVAQYGSGNSAVILQ